MGQPDTSQRKKIAILALLIAACVIAIGYEAFDHQRRMAQAGTEKTIAQATIAKQPVVQNQTIPEMLVAINKTLSPETCPYLNYGQALLLRAKLDDPANEMTPDIRISTATKCAEQLLNAGKTQESLAMYKSIIEQIKANDPGRWDVIGSNLLTFQAIAYLRMGEQENCCDHNNSRSCLLPISGSGIHTKQEGSRGAVKCLLEALKQKPDNMSARWLLNIAYMTIGEYPQKVPARWLIPIRKFGGDYPMKRFDNAAPQLGLDVLGRAGGVIMEDFEGNGLLDLAISTVTMDGQLRYFRNNGDGTFTDRTKDSGLIGETGGLNMITTDYNNDGKPDIIVLRGGWMGKSGHYPLSLLRNDGDGRFTDVTLQAGLLTMGPTQTAVAFDYNGDGWLDLFVGYESTPEDPRPCKLFRNNGNGTFTDVTQQCGLDIRRFVKGVISADFTHSGRPGLYLSCSGEPNILLRNDGPEGTDKSPTGPWKFTDITTTAGVDKQHSSFSCFFFDYDNDGWPDIYVGGYGGATEVGDIASDYLGLPTPAEKAKLYHNNHDGTFTDVSRQAHLDKVVIGMGINFGDLDNDGWKDFYVGTGDPSLGTIVPNRMFRNHNGKFFDEVTTTGDFGHLQKGHGIAFGDLNNIGQQDVFLVAGGAYEADTAHSCLYLNPGNKNHWVTLQLTGVKSNRAAIGAEICVTVDTPHGERKIYQTVGPGGSFGNNPLRQHIGLGDATRIKSVTVHWPASGIDQTLKSIPMDRFYRVREGAPEMERWSPPAFNFKPPRIAMGTP